jgi:hypothetical protein
VNGMMAGVNSNVFVTPADIGPSVNNWLGRSQWGADPLFNGSIAEVRIWEGAITPLQVALNAAAGPDLLITDPGPLQSVDLALPTEAASLSQSRSLAV